MNLTLFLEIFLLVDVFLVGVLVSTAVRHARAHFARPAPAPTPVPSPTEPLPERNYVSPAMRERFIKESQTQFETAVNASVQQLEQSLGATAAQLDQLVRRLGGEIVSTELERYRVELGQLRQQAAVDMGAIKTEVTAHRAELEQQAAAEFAAERQRLAQQINTKLGDVMSSFLLEALQHEVDLGAQEPYLLALLEQHKQDFLNEVADEPNQTAQ